MKGRTEQVYSLSKLNLHAKERNDTIAFAGLAGIERNRKHCVGNSKAQWQQQW